jgi:DNA-binding NarL/FixJ family response regulator
MFSAGQGPACPPAAGAPIRVLIVSDHCLTRSGLRRLLEDGERGCAVSEGAGDDDAAEAARRADPHVVLVDRDSFDAARFESTVAAVRAATSAPVLVVASECPTAAKHDLVRAGAMGCVTKDQTADDLARAVERVGSGGVWFDRSTLADVVAGIQSGEAAAQGAAPLTTRETEIVESVAEGLKNKQIARRLFISEVTVRHHLTSIYSKVGVGNRQKLMLYAFEHGIARPPGGQGA